MTLNKFSKEEISEMSMVELAYEILAEEKKALHFKELFETIAEAKGLSEQQKENVIAQFYTDLNIEGKILSIGQNMWGLKAWYPYDQSEDDILLFPDEEEERPKKKRKKKTDDFIEDDVLVDDADDFDLEADDIEEDDLYDDDDEDGADFSDDEELFEEDEELIDEDLELEDEEV